MIPTIRDEMSLPRDNLSPYVPSRQMEQHPMKFTLSDLITVPCSRKPDRRQFIGGSDARIIMSPEEAALIRLWKEKRGEAEPEDLSGNLGVATEELTRTWRCPLGWIALTSLHPTRANELRSPRKTRPRRF